MAGDEKQRGPRHAERKSPGASGKSRWTKLWRIPIRPAIRHPQFLTPAMKRTKPPEAAAGARKAEGFPEGLNLRPSEIIYDHCSFSETASCL
jgi:hypothetical protein